jgi:hypothetical protein
MSASAVGALEDLGDAPVEALDHAAGLRPVGLGEAVFDGVLGADSIEGMLARGLTLPRGTESAHSCPYPTQAKRRLSSSCLRYCVACAAVPLLRNNGV